MNRSIKKVIQVNGKRFSRPDKAAEALAAALASDLGGDGWHIEFDNSIADAEAEAKNDKEWDDWEKKCDRIEARAYPRYLKVCKRILA